MKLMGKLEERDRPVSEGRRGGATRGQGDWWSRVWAGRGEAAARSLVADVKARASADRAAVSTAAPEP